VSDDKVVNPISLHVSHVAYNLIIYIYVKNYFSLD